MSGEGKVWAERVWGGGGGGGGEAENEQGSSNGNGEETSYFVTAYGSHDGSAATILYLRAGNTTSSIQRLHL